MTTEGENRVFPKTGSITGYEKIDFWALPKTHQIRIVWVGTKNLYLTSAQSERRLKSDKLPTALN